jgi:hypothetical protein
MTNRNSSTSKIVTISIFKIRILSWTTFGVFVFFSFSAKAKTIFEDVKKIIYQIERAIRHKKIFCLGGCFPSARKALIKRGWVEVAVRSRSALGRPQHGPFQSSQTEEAGYSSFL